MDGEDFVEWAKSFKRIAAGRHERPENVVCFMRRVSPSISSTYVDSI